MKRSLLRIGIALAILVTVTGFAAAAAQGEAAATAEPLEITWFAWRGIPGEGAPIPPMVEDLISKKVGFPVKFNMVGGVQDGEMHNTQQMMLAANELPDVFNRFNIDPEFLAQAATKFSVKTLQDNMPMMYKFLGGLMDQLDMNPDATWGIYQDATDKMLWGVPRIWDMGWVPSGQMWREDILDDLGYDVPTTLAEAEEVFEAYKSVYPNKYAVSGRGGTNWQCFDLVFNAYGFSFLTQTVRDNTVKQAFATREFREALVTLRRWYEKGFWDPDFVTHQLELYQNFAAGNYLAIQWIGRSEWDFNTGEDTAYLNNLRDNVPGARAVAATHLKADANTKPGQGVWNPFLTQLTVFGKHLENDPARMKKIMQVGDILSQDREAIMLSQWGVEGVHWDFPEGETVPKLKTEIASMPVAEQMDKYGFGFCWQGNLSTYSWMSKRAQKVLDDFVLSPSGPYHSSKVNYLFPIVTGSVRDLAGEVVQASTPTSWFQLTVDIMTGVQPIEYYDEWLQAYYDSGGKAWEEHATRLYLPK
jgi:putative aldouronate transport system substrate-binding protein